MEELRKRIIDTSRGRIKSLTLTPVMNILCSVTEPQPLVTSYSHRASPIHPDFTEE